MTSRISDRIARTTTFARGVVQRVLDTFPGVQRVVTEVVRIEVIDRCMIIAAQGLLTLTPLLIVLATFLPTDLGSGLVTRIEEVMGLDQATGALIRQTQDTVGASTQTGVIGVLVVLASALSFAKSIQRMLERVWERTTRRGMISRRNCLLWLVGWLAYLELLNLARQVLDGDGGRHLLRLLSQLVVSALFWTWSAHFLLQRRVPWGQLWCGALLTAVGVVILIQGSRLVMPRYTESNIAQFGPFGLVFSIASWLIAFAGVLVIASLLGRVISEDERILGAVARVRRRPAGSTAGRASG